MLHRTPLLLALSLLALSGLLMACASPDEATPTPPFGLPPIELPRDESPHEFQAEWWYFNLHLETADKRRFALHDVVFQIQQPETSRTLYVRQIGLTDADGEHSTAERARAASKPLPGSPGNFEIVMGDWNMQGEEGASYLLHASVGGYEYNFKLASTGPPLLHGGLGILDYHDAGVTYYYTRPRLHASGSVITPGGETLKVTGLGWLDKQWGDFQPVAVEWDWASIQLDDGTDLMLSLLYDRDGVPVENYATLRRPGGSPQTLKPDEFSFLPSGPEWRSIESRATYKIEWKVDIPAHGIHLTLRPLSENAEFRGTLLPVTYWESGVDVTDETGQLVGQGFIELNWAPGRAR